MSRYEVFVPAAEPAQPFALTLRIQAEHWLAALKIGLEKIGSAQVIANVLCDIQVDGSIHVTDPQSGRVFRISELPAAAPESSPPSPPPPAERPAPVPPSPRPGPRLVAVPPPEPPPPVAPRVVRPAPAAAPEPGRPRPSAAADRVEQVLVPSAVAPATIGRVRPPGPRRVDVLAELFERVAELPDGDIESGLGYLLDLAIEKTACEAGSVFLARLRELEFAVARGPRAAELLRLGLKVPVGVGIVGFCAQENVCVAVSDAEKDARFYRAVSKAIGYETRSLLCAPIARQGRVRGALEVLNKRDGRPFEEQDQAVLAYLAHQAAELLERLEG
jgi:hypothetical protein